MTWIRTALLLCFCSFGCGHQGADDDDADPVALQNCNKVASAACERAMVCQQQRDGVDASTRLSSLDSCKANSAFRCVGADGTGSNLEQCLATIGALTCDLATDLYDPESSAGVRLPKGCEGVVIFD